MAEEKETKKKAAAKKPAAPKTQAKTEKAAAPAPKKEAAPKKAASGKLLRVTQIASPIGRQAYQRRTLIGLGLNKLGRTRELQDTPSIRGMIESVGHLVRIEDAA